VQISGYYKVNLETKRPSSGPKLLHLKYPTLQNDQIRYREWYDFFHATGDTFVDRSAADFSDKLAVSASPKRRYQTTNQHSFVSQTTNLHTRY